MAAGIEAIEAGDAPDGARSSDGLAQELVMAMVARHGESLLNTARRHSLCADDAQDAYQRTMEILMRRAATLDPERAHLWTHTVCKHEAMAVRRQRQQLVAAEEVDFDREEARHLPSPEERLVSFDRMRRSAEALQRLKPQELRALWLRAQGFSYAEICEQTGWTHTKTNRCLAEGRRAFLARYAGIEAGEECERWLPLLSAIVDGEATPEQLVAARPHLRNCPSCRATVRELHAAGAPLAALIPVGAVPAIAHVHEPASGLFARVYEALAGGVHDRTAAAALKVQAATEAASVGKMAAIAASAAALAGGGAVAVNSATTDHPRSESAQHRVHVRHPRTAPATATRADARAQAPSAPAPRRRPAHTEFAPARGGDGAAAKREFSTASAATAPAAPPPDSTSAVVASSSPERGSSGGEFSGGSREFGG